jgi:hypothetical protein
MVGHTLVLGGPAIEVSASSASALPDLRKVDSLPTQRTTMAQYDCSPIRFAELNESTRLPSPEDAPHGSLCRGSFRPASTECKRIQLNAGIEKLDGDLMIDDGPRLPNQLVHALLSNGSVALVVKINARGGANRLSIDERPKAYWGSVRRSHHQVQIARMKRIGNRAVRLGGCDRVTTSDPVARQSPMIESQRGGRRIQVMLVRNHSVARYKIVGALVAQVIFRGLEVLQVGGYFCSRGFYQR